MGERRKCETCGDVFLAANPSVLYCSVACDQGGPRPKMCRYCGAYFKPRNGLHSVCRSEKCRRAADNARKMALNARHKAPGPIVKDNSPFKPCVTCTYWKKEPVGVTDMGGQCIVGLYRACKPWDEAIHYKEAR